MNQPNSHGSSVVCAGVGQNIILPDLRPNPEFSVAASRDRLERPQSALRAVNIETQIVPDRNSARERVPQLVPAESEGHVGLSETMREISGNDVVEKRRKYLAN